MPNKTVWEEISGGNDEIELGKRKVASRAYVSWFNFKGAAQQRKVGTLSGGERNRVHLAKLLKKGSNLLLLDEPTNDLDVDTLRALEEALLNFAGCAVVISHDRWFLDRIATHMLAFEGDSEVVWFEGNYQDYEADRKRRLGADGRSAAPDQISQADATVASRRPPGVIWINAMCRNIKTLFNFDPPATDEEIRAASLQFVRKLSGFNAPSKANEAAFERAIDDVASVARRLIDSLPTRRRAATARKWRLPRAPGLRSASADRPQRFYLFICLRKRRQASGQNSSHALPPSRDAIPSRLRVTVWPGVVTLGGSQAFSIRLLKTFPA